MGIFHRRSEQPPEPAGTNPHLPELEQASFKPAGSDGRSAEVDEPIICEAPVSSRPKPRGLLTVPEEVREIAARKLERSSNLHHISPTEDAMKRVIDSLTLQYYYEGFDVAYRMTRQGVEVLAVGHEEIGQLVRGSSESERAAMQIGQP